LSKEPHCGGEREPAPHRCIAEHVRPDKRLCCMLAPFLYLDFAFPILMSKADRKSSKD
jgi:hypothetical protein